MWRRGHRATSGGASGVPLALGLAAAIVAGCERDRPLTEADCTMIKQKVAAAWNRDAVAAQRLVDTDTFTPFIGEEGARIESAVLEACRGAVGRKIRDKELECLRAADTIDDVYECAPR